MRRILIIGALSVSIPVLSQTDADALRYSMVEYMGSARFLGAGGAFTALGGDIAAIGLNPAGIGQYRVGEISLSPAFHISKSDASFLAETHSDARLNFNVSSFGLVFSKSGESRRPPRGRWEAINWGFGYNRMANFNEHVTMSGVNPNNSLIDRFVQEANGTHANDLHESFPFGAGLAYEAYLFNPNNDSVSYTGIVPNGGVRQTKEIISRGGNEEWFVAFGANLANKFMFGASVNLPSVNYVEESWHTEEDYGDSIPGFTSFTQYTWLHTRGSGISGKVGVTGIFADLVRVGVAYHSPAYIGLRDGYYTSITNEEPSEYRESAIGNYRYALITPAHINAGLAVMIKKAGFISVDYEYVDYSQAGFRFKNEQAYQDQVNGDIQSKYGPASNIRVGGELVLQEYRLRAGAQFAGTPFQPGVAEEGGDYSRTTFSGGLGYRGPNFFADVAYALSSTGTAHVPYTLADASEIVAGALIDRVTHNILFTLGYKFR